MIDLLASRPQYLAHLDPVWDALPARLRGDRKLLEPRQQRAGAVLVASWQDLGAAKRAGYKRVAYLEHGIGQPYGPNAIGYPGGIGREGVHLFLSPNDTAAAADRRAYPQAQVVVVGDPGVDVPLERSPEPGLVLVSFHWDCHIAPESRSALQHYRAALAQLATTHDVLGHAHPRAPELVRLWNHLGVPYEPSWPAAAKRAAVYVCDNSSTLYEFAAAGGPVVVLNAPWFRQRVNHGLRFWTAAGVGVQVDDPTLLPAAIDLALVDAPAQQRARSAAVDLVYAHRGSAATRAATALTAWVA